MWIEVVRTIPTILWFLLVIALLVLFYRPICEELLPKLSGFKAGGVEFSFVQSSIDAAIELAEKSDEWEIKVPEADKERALKRARRHLRVFRDAQVLWVDDRPETNLKERKMFRQLGMDIEIAKSTEEALDVFRIHDFDLVISDMYRDDKATAGLELLEQIRKEDKTTPVIFYVGDLDPKKGVPPQAFGITKRPDELLHLTIDALERKKS